MNEKVVLPPQIFITGTGTDVGKSVVAAMLLAGTRGFYWKPVQSGLEPISDSDWVRRATDLPQDHFLPETYRFRNPLSPHAAAALEGVRIDLTAFRLPVLPGPGHLIVEGAGGVLVPLNERHFMLDLIVQLALPVLVVASSRLGTINHTLLTLQALRSRRVSVVGIVLNGPEDPSNRRAIEHFGGIPVVAQIEPLPAITPEALGKTFSRHFAASAAS
jgi:dethiobiotin synthetase